MKVVSFDPKEIINILLDELSERSRDVIERRYGLGGGDRHTLERIGQNYGITRERVRQIENLAKEQMRDSDMYARKARNPITELKKLIDRCGGVVEEDSFLQTVSPSDLDANHIYLLLDLGEHFAASKESDEHRRAWYTSDRAHGHVKDTLEKVYKDLDSDELVTESEIVDRFLGRVEHEQFDCSVSKDHVCRWLKLSKKVGQNKLGHWGRANSPNIKIRGVRDQAYLILQDKGEPMHFSEIAEEIENRFGEHTNRATCHNELIKDARFLLVGRGLYGLADWGLFGGTVSELITELLQEHGEMAEEEIINKVLERKLVKRSTVIINLKNKRLFSQDKASKLYSLKDKKVAKKK